MNPCAVKGCPSVARCRGWCNTHYERWRRTGDPGGTGDARRRPVVECSVDGCTERTKARGLCNRHYVCWKRTGQATPPQRPNYGQGRRVGSNGYVNVWEPAHPLAMADGYVLEHRKIAWDAGLLTDPAMLVHHEDEDKQNNDLANLRVKDPSTHASDHVHERGTVRNQYGEWPVRRARTP